MREHNASRTALVVAKSQALVGAAGESDLRIDASAVAFANRALEMAGHGAFVRALRFASFRRLLRWYESIMIPGLARHHVLRKHHIERRVREALESGVRRVIQIGAGLDSLCFRLHRVWPDTTFIELDHPATQALKGRLLDSLGTGENLHLRPLDLGDANPNFLAETPGKGPSIIVAEGVLMYLPPGRVAGLLRNWRRFGGSESRLLFTFMEGPGFKNQSLAVNGWLRLAREPFLWHAGRSSVNALLHESGWKLAHEHATWRGSRGAKVAEGEWIASARPAPMAKNREETRLAPAGEAR